MKNVKTKQAIIANFMTNGRRYTLTAILALAASIANAQWRTAEDATALLGKYADNNAMPKTVKAKFNSAAKETRLLYTMQTDGRNTIYVMGTKGNGIVLVSGFEGEDIIGYTDRGNSFDIDSIPPALRLMMEDYSQQMIEAAKNWTPERRNAAKAQQRTARQPIDHLIQTRWDQSDVYSSMCPTNYTGCTATAFAQIMKYYNYPEHGTGSNSYTWNGQTLSANFADTKYQWDKMLDKYKSGCYSEESGNAVATLMYHLGVALKMNYGQDASSAVFDAKVISKYFDYNPNFTNRKITGTEEDINLMYEQLEKKQPIPYRSSGDFSDGHAFIVDGYSNGLWGINWGWGGAYDGYYAIGALNPTDNYHFNTDNTATLNLVPNGSYTADKMPVDGEFTVSSPGSLKAMLGNTRYKKLTIHGRINGTDLRELRSRCSSYDEGYYPVAQSLRELDLSDTRIVEGGVYYKQTNSSTDESTEYTAKADVLSASAFNGSELETLRLPNSVKKMERMCIWNCNSIKNISLPASLETYERGAIWLWNLYSDVDITVPESSCLTKKDGIIYKKDFSQLLLCTNNNTKIIIDPRCKSVDYYAFDYYKSKIETFIAPGATSFTANVGYDLKNLWLGNVSQFNPYYLSNETTRIFLPSKKKVEARTSADYKMCEKLYVPKALIQEYKDDSNWYPMNRNIEAIEDCGIVLDDCGVIMLENVDMMSNSFESIDPQMVDTRLMNSTMSFTSSNPNIAAVNNDNELMSFAAGKADITLKVGDMTKVCHVSVNEWPTLNVEQPGTFQSICGNNTYKYLRVTGSINGNDMKQIRYLCNAEDISSSGYYVETNPNPVLEYLDLKDAKLVKGGAYGSFWNKDYTLEDDKLASYMFCVSNLVQLRLPAAASKTTEKVSVMVHNSNMKYLEIPEDMTSFSAKLITKSDGISAVVYRGQNFLQPASSGSYDYFHDATLYVRKSLLSAFRSNNTYKTAFKAIEAIDDFSATGIESIDVMPTTENDAIYNIMGQRIPSLQKGINIVNGKKILVEQ